ncbi:MAG: serine protease [Gammaproteobacteria bacterium]|nr:serine protease [Gammaproteobacteria bacterium]
MRDPVANILKNPELLAQILEEVETEEAAEATGRRGIAAVSEVRSAIESVAEGRETTVSPHLEAIIRRTGRPVLFVQDGLIEEPRLPLWQQRLASAREALERVIPSVGRIELRGHPRYNWVGTGWHIAPRVIITNRHVADVFGRQSGSQFVFRLRPDGGEIKARIDFVEEHQRPGESEFAIREILHIEDDTAGRPDMALLRVAPRDMDDEIDLPAPIPLSAADAEPDQVIGAVGYAAWDGDRNERELMDEIFQMVYEVKRLHPGEIMAVQDHFVNHDCSTLGGNSGSAILDFATGNAVALHYAGRFEDQNYAVKASTIRTRLEELNIDITAGV